MEKVVVVGGRKSNDSGETRAEILPQAGDQGQNINGDAMLIVSLI